MKLRLLGVSQIELGASSVRPTATHLFSLLLYVALERDRVISRSELVSQLFPGVKERESSHSLRQLLYRAKRIGAPLIVLNSDVHVAPDAVEDEICTLLASRRVAPKYLKPGHLSILPHFEPPTPPLCAWIERYRDRIRPELIQLLAADLQVARARVDWRLVDDISKSLLELDPLNETAILCAAEALARFGSKHQAVIMLRQFEAEVGKSSNSLALPPRLLARRISEASQANDGLVDTVLVGRDAEIQRLESFWARCLGGRFMSVVLCGPESIGKTHLAAEFSASIRMQGSGAVVFSRRAPLDTQRPLSVFADIAKELLSLRGAAGCSPESLSLISRLTKTSSSSDVDVGDQRDLEYLRIGISRAIVDLLDSVLTERPLLLVFDDAEHLDGSSLSLLRELEIRLSTRPCLLLRVLRHPELEDSRAAARLRLDALDSSAALSLATAINSGFTHPLPQDTCSRCVALAAGNPGHLRLLLLHRARSRHDDNVPMDLLAAIDGRLGSLSPKALHLLQACAVYGAACPTSVVARLTGIRGYSLIRSVQQLEDNALVALRPGGLECTSSLVRERALATASRTTTAFFHLRAARYLERGLASAPAPQSVAWTIAEHWHKAGIGDAALRWQQRCWQQLVAIGQPKAAVESIRAAFLASSGITERAALLSALAGALRALGDFASLAHVLQERIALGAELGDSQATQSALSFDLFEATIDAADMPASLARLANYVRNVNLDALRRLRACRLLMIAADQSFDSTAANEAYSALQHIRVTEPNLKLLWLHSALIYHTTFGDRKEGLDHVTRIEHLSSGIPRSWIRVTSITSCLTARRVMDCGPFLTASVETAFADSQDYGVFHTAHNIAALLSVTHFDEGNLKEARSWAASSESIATGISLRQMVTDHFASQIDLSLLDGRLERAASLLRALEEKVGNASGTRVRRELLVYRAKVAQFCGQGTTDRDLTELLHFHELGSRLGRHDDTVEVIWAALTERGATARASALLEQYLASARREVRRCNFFLRTRTATDPVWSRSDLRRFA